MSHATVLVVTESPSEEAVAAQMAPFDEYLGPIFGDGSRWDWWVIGGRYSGRLHGKDQVQRGDLSLGALVEDRKAWLRESWAKAMQEKDRKSLWLYDIEPDDTEDTYIARFGYFSAYAFLRNRHWNERERMGWFGGTAKTECEIAEVDAAKCLFIFPDDSEFRGSRIVSWGNDPKWQEKFWKRFVEPLPNEAWLTMVDYHV